MVGGLLEVEGALVKRPHPVFCWKMQKYILALFLVPRLRRLILKPDQPACGL